MLHVYIGTALQWRVPCILSWLVHDDGHDAYFLRAHQKGELNGSQGVVSFGRQVDRVAYAKQSGTRPWQMRGGLKMLAIPSIACSSELQPPRSRHFSMIFCVCIACRLAA